MSHTPAPWHLDDKGVVYGGEYCIAITECYSAIKSKSKKERDANARLITAAPELLHALQLLTNPRYLVASNPFNSSAEHHPFIEKARLAIAKATEEKI